MSKPLRVLLVEDSEDDALMVVRELKQGGYAPIFERVDTPEAMQAALDKQEWDVIIADYSLPHFSAPAALKLLQEGVDLPFIVVTGTVGEETAVAAMKAGAHDYMFKRNLKRLVPAVEREIREAIVRRERKQAEEALRESEAFNASLLDSAPNPIHVLNPDMSLRYVNPALERLTGFSKSELMGRKPPYPWWPPEKQQEYDVVYQEAMTRGPVFRQERLFQKKTGEPFWVEITGINIISAGQHKYHLTNWVDITERKKAEEALRENTEFNSALLENAPNPIHVLNPDMSLRYVNPAFERLTGFSKAELMGRKPPYPWWPPGKQQEYNIPFKKAMLEGVSRRERLFQKKTGEPFWVEITSTNIQSAGQLKYHLTNWVDIIERKQAEERLRQAAEEWRTTFDSITDMVSIHDKDFRLVRVNRAFASVFKAELKALIGKPCYELVHGTNEPVPDCPHKKTLETQKPATAEYLEPHLGMHLEVSCSPIFDEKGELVGSVHVARDVTERKQMQEQLIMNDRLASIGELASGVAHELNNPLTSVIGFSQLLMEREIPADVKEDLGIIHREAQRTANIVKGLLTFARKHAPVKQSVNVKNIIETVLELRAYEQKVSNIQVVKRFADLPEIMADYFQLQQVFLNIIVNAEYFMIQAHNRGTLTITTEKIGDMVRASIADDGPGIAEESMRHMFNPFFTTKPVGKGTGLGLSICHGIVTAHGGKIYVQSKPGAGATFIVELPTA